jgi:Secretion system C-terminal sorting domain/YHYH protein
MKKIIIIALYLISVSIYSHSGHDRKTVLRQWHFSDQNKIVNGSFYMIKDGEVYIESADDNIVHFPFSSFSIIDQAFALKKNEWVTEINKEIAIINQTAFEESTPFKTRQVILFLMIFIIVILLFRFTDRKKLVYVIPTFIVITGIIFCGFSNHAMKKVVVSTSTAFLDSTFNPFKPNINTYFNSTYYYVESKGIPLHGMMVGIASNGWQQQVPIPQCYIGANAWPIPLNPIVAATPVPVNAAHFSRGAIAIAANGVAIFNPYTNTGVDAFLDGQLDNFGGHCGRADDYHYHTAPLHLYSLTSPTLPIAFALDGFAVYGSAEPDGAAMLALDINHGHYRNGVYHYHGSAAAPYMIGSMVGQVTEDASKQIIPQAQASPVRMGQNPLPGALITSCTANALNNGYSLNYTLNAQTYTVAYNWSTAGTYAFSLTSPTGVTNNNYNGFTQCSVPTAIEENTLTNFRVAIYPNPTSDKLFVQLGKGLINADIKTITIHNLKGELVYQSKEYKCPIDTKAFSVGTYFIKVTLTNSQLVKKIIIQ